MKQITWGMIGCGDVTEIKNGPGLYLANNSYLKGITNRTITKAEDWIKRHNHGIVYQTVEDLLADDEIDIVYIAVTPDKHMEYAIACANAGKHCLIEKPLALNYEEGLEIKKAFDKAGKKAFVAFYRRALNKFQKVKQLMESGRIGKIEAVNVVRYVPALTDKEQWRAQESISGGNIFTETDIHTLDFIDYIMGEVVEFHYTKSVSNKESYSFDSLALNLKFENGCIGSGQWLYNCNKSLDRFEVIGRDGIISFQVFHGDTPISVLDQNGTETIMVEDSSHVGLNMEQLIVDELNGCGEFSGTVEAALRSLLIADTIYHDK